MHYINLLLTLTLTLIAQIMNLLKGVALEVTPLIICFHRIVQVICVCVCLDRGTMCYVWVTKGKGQFWGKHNARQA